jgi:hypothetical protein
LGRGQHRGPGGTAPRRGAPRGARGAAWGRRKGRGRERERGGVWGSSPWGSKNLAITVTGSPRDEVGEREVEERERELLHGKKLRERDRDGERAHGWREGRKESAGPGRTGLGREPGRKPTTHTTTDRKPIANRNLKRGEADSR